MRLNSGTEWLNKLKKRKKRIEEAKQAKLEHDENIMNIVKEETGIDEDLDNVIKYDQL